MFLKTTHLKWLIFFLSILAFFLADKVHAASDHLLINEVYPHEIASEGEWIELFNPTTGSIPLSGCAIEDGTHHPKVLDAYPDIAPGAYFILNGGTDFSFALNNDVEEVELKCASVLVDDLKYGNVSLDPIRTPAPVAGKSLTRVSVVDTDNWAADFISAFATKGASYQKPIFSTEVRINELLPAPASGAEEYIELYNTGSGQIDLSGWVLRDEGGTEYSFPDQTILTANGFVFFQQSVTHIYLNNTGGETLYLVDPNGDIVSQVNYQDAQSSASFSFFSDGWKWTEALTPGTENIFLAGSSGNAQLSDIISVAEAKKRSVGETIIVQGAVTAIPGSLGSQYFYLQDDSSGIQIYCYYKDFPALQAGDVIRVTGVIAFSGGEIRIKIAQSSDIVIVSSLPPILPVTVDPAVSSPELVGRYVETSGVVESPSGTTFYVASAKGRIKIQVKNSGLVQKPKLRAGDQVQVRGILSIYNGTLRILPFEAGSVKILKSGATLPASGPEYLAYPLLSFFTLILWKSLQPLLTKLKSWRNPWPAR